MLGTKSKWGREVGRGLGFTCAMLATLGLTAQRAEALKIGPDAFGYTASNEVAFSFVDISSTGTQTLAGQDDQTDGVVLGFSFDFYGASFTQIFFNTNGLITFDVPTSDSLNGDLTLPSVLDSLGGVGAPAIAVLWDDWQFFQGGADAVYYQTLGSAGSRQFVVQWNLAFGFAFSPSPVTFQAILFEGSNEILFQYLDANSGDTRAFGGEASVGIRNVGAGSSGEVLQWSFNSAALSNGEAILFTIPEPSAFALVASGLLGLALFGSRRRSRS